MKEKLQKIREEAIARIKASHNLDALNEVRVSVLGKKGELTALLKSMKEVAPEDRPAFGQLVNDTRAEIEKVMEEAKKNMDKLLLDAKLKSEVIETSEHHCTGRSGAHFHRYGI